MAAINLTAVPAAGFDRLPGWIFLWYCDGGASADQIARSGEKRADFGSSSRCFRCSCGRSCQLFPSFLMEKRPQEL